MKRQRGFGLLEMLLALAVLAIITGFVGQNLVTVFQANHESNAASGIVDVMLAESQYKQVWGSYATGSNAAYLSACPVTGAPTATTACLTAKTFTNEVAYNNYTWSILLPPDAGYLVIAQPQNVYAGRLTYCGSATDPLVHGLVSATVPSITTAAACSALPPIKQGAITPVTTAYSTTGSGLLTAGSTATLSLNLPAGSYTVAAPFSFGLSKTPSGLSQYAVCNLMQGATLIQTMTMVSSGQAFAQGGSGAMDRTTLVGIVSGPTVTLSCTNHFDGGVGIINNMQWAASLVATPVSQVVTQ